MPNLFNAQQFFENTAHFASKGRGKIIIGKPIIFQQDRYINERIDKGFAILGSGISAIKFTIPDQMLATHQRFSYLGPTREMPINQVFGDLNVDFILSNRNKEDVAAVYSTLVRWQEVIAGPATGKTIANSTDVPQSDFSNFGVSYYNDYTTDAVAEIYTQTNSGDSALRIKYTELYPKLVGDLSISWDSDDSPITLTTVFAYYYSKILTSRSSLSESVDVIA